MYPNSSVFIISSSNYAMFQIHSDIIECMECYNVTLSKTYVRSNRFVPNVSINIETEMYLHWTLNSHWLHLRLSWCPPHRYERPQAACREPTGSYDKTTRTAICFEHKTQYLLILVPYTRIVVFWHISNIPPMISQSQISCNTPTFYIAAIFVKYCYTTGSWLL